jgi:hypothetical protein
MVTYPGNAHFLDPLLQSCRPLLSRNTVYQAEDQRQWPRDAGVDSNNTRHLAHWNHPSSTSASKASINGYKRHLFHFYV